MPTGARSGAKEDAFLFPFLRDSHLCNGIMLQLEEKKKRKQYVSLVALFRKIRSDPF